MGHCARLWIIFALVRDRPLHGHARLRRCHVTDSSRLQLPSSLLLRKCRESCACSLCLNSTLQKALLLPELECTNLKLLFLPGRKPEADQTDEKIGVIRRIIQNALSGCVAPQAPGLCR